MSRPRLRWKPVVGWAATLLVFAAFVWFLGPLVAVGVWHPLESELARALLIGAALTGPVLHRALGRRAFVLGPLVNVAVVLVCVASLAAMGVSYVKSRAQIADAAARVEALRHKLAGAIPPDSVSALLPTLRAVRALRLTSAGGDVHDLQLGLSQQKRLDALVRSAYRRMLRETLWPPLATRIEQLARQDADDEMRYEAFKAYLMLFTPQHFDANALATFIEVDWQQQFRHPEEQEEFNVHLAALLAEGVPAPPFAQDQALVATVRARLAASPLPDRIYGRLKRLGVDAKIPSFSVLTAAGHAAGAVLVRQSGQSLSQAVPALYTRDGYERGFVPAIDRVVDQLAREQTWVLGAGPEVAATRELADEVWRRYLADYARAWEALIADLRLAPTRDLPSMLELASALSAAGGPLSQLVLALSRETTLTEPGLSPHSLAGRLAESIRAGPSSPLRAGQTATRVESLVNDRFAGLRRVVTVPKGAAQPPLDHAMTKIEALYQWLFALQSAPAAGYGGARVDPALPLRAEAARLPEPLRSMFNDLAARTESIAVTAAKR